MERHALSLADGRISYLAGRAERPGRPIVFVHGLSIDARTWLAISDQIDGRNWLAIDLPGHGASEWRSQYSFPSDAQALIGLVAELDGPVVAVGHSRGAQVCLLAAALQPHLFAALYLEDLTPRFWWEARNRGLVFAGSVFALRDLANTAKAEGRDSAWMARQIGALKHDAQTTFGERLTATDLEVWADAVLNFDPEMLGSKAVFGPPDFTAAQLLTSIDGPIHLAHGDVADGSAVLGEELAWFHATARQPSSTRFAGLGHFLHGARPLEFAADLRQFLERTG